MPTTTPNLGLHIFDNATDINATFEDFYMAVAGSEGLADSDMEILDEYLGGQHVATENIQADAVTTDKIAPGAITATELASNAVTTSKILDGAVTPAKIANRTRSFMTFTGTIHDYTVHDYFLEREGIPSYSGDPVYPRLVYASWFTVPEDYVSGMKVYMVFSSRESVDKQIFPYSHAWINTFGDSILDFTEAASLSTFETIPANSFKKMAEVILPDSGTNPGDIVSMQAWRDTEDATDTAGASANIWFNGFFVEYTADS